MLSWIVLSVTINDIENYRPPAPEATKPPSGLTVPMAGLSYTIAQWQEAGEP